MKIYTVKIWGGWINRICIIGIITSIIFFSGFFSGRFQGNFSLNALKRSINKIKLQYKEKVLVLKQQATSLKKESDLLLSQIENLTEKNMELKFQNEHVRKKLDIQLCALSKARKKWRDKVNQKYPDLLCSIKQDNIL